MNKLLEAEKLFHEIQLTPDIYLKKFLEDAFFASKKTIISRGPLFNLRPFQNERAGVKLGKEVGKIPKNGKNAYVYHLNDKGKVLLVFIYGQSEEIINKEFSFYEENMLKSIYFTSTGTLRNITLSSICNECILQDNNFGKFGCSVSDYLYDGSKLKKISVIQKEHNETEFSTYDVLFEYDEAQLVKIFNSFPNGYLEQRFP